MIETQAVEGTGTSWPVNEYLPVYTFSLTSGISPTPEFAKKGLAEFAVNVGLKCGHGCTYCSSGALLRCHRAFKEIGRSPFAMDYAVVDPDVPERIAKAAARKRQRGIVQLCTTVDAWCPAAQKYQLGRRCLEALLAQPGWIVRILTKNAAVADDFDLIQKHKDRVLVGLSLTGTADQSGVLSVVEPNASPIQERMAALQEAHRLGLQTYGMLCPLLPGIADAARQIDELVAFVRGCGAKELFAEAVNPRGPGLKLTQEALGRRLFLSQAWAVSQIRNQRAWSAYVTRLIGDVQRSARRHGLIGGLRFLLYPGGLVPEDRAQIARDDAGVVWLS
jgi:DNA repair photolyase